MATYDLNNLVEWTRRWSGDRKERITEQIVANGTAYLELNVDGYISIDSIRDDNVLIDSANYTQVDNGLIHFTDPGTVPVVDSSLRIVFFESKFSDDEVLDYLTDAARSVAGELHLSWTVNTATNEIDDVSDELLPGGDEDELLIELMVSKASLGLVIDKNTSAGDDAIMVRDGDTVIDTSKAIGGTAKSVNSASARYDRLMTRARYRRFHGAACNE